MITPYPITQEEWNEMKQKVEGLEEIVRKLAEALLNAGVIELVQEDGSVLTPQQLADRERNLQKSPKW